MTDEDKIAAVHAKVEREMRFTRSLVLLCTAAILGTLLLILTMMTTQIPDLIWLKLEGELGPMQTSLARIEKTLELGRSPLAPAADKKEADKKE